MVIPKGKKFQIRNAWTGDLTDNTNPVLDSDESKDIIVPSYGYKGNAYISQDVNFGIQNQFSKPLEGILDRVPNIADAALRLNSGISLRNNRSASMKYWTGTEPLELDIEVTFETQVDSFYDVYLPVVNLLSMSAPGESEKGFYEPPAPTIQFLAGEAKNLANSIKTSNLEIGVRSAGGGGTSISGKALAGMLGRMFNSLPVKTSGYVTNIYIGNNFKFENAIIKSVRPTFSSNLCYAPMRFVNDIIDKYFPNYVNANAKRSLTYALGHKDQPSINPYTMSDTAVKIFSQTVGAAMAVTNNLKDFLSKIAFEAAGSFLPKSPAEIEKILKAKGELHIPAYPISATVALSLELQYPLTKSEIIKASNSGSNGGDTSVTSITNTFVKDDGSNEFGY